MMKLTKGVRYLIRAGLEGRNSATLTLQAVNCVRFYMPSRKRLAGESHREPRRGQGQLPLAGSALRVSPAPEPRDSVHASHRGVSPGLCILFCGR